jgi:hypothetical protein
MIIGIIGFIGAGKGTVGDILVQRGFHKDSFAAPLKDATATIFNWPRNMLEGDTNISRLWREKKDEYWSNQFGYDFTPRTALQLMGTEVGRKVFHENLWIISLLNRARGHDNVVITDVRFKNEIKTIRKDGGFVVRVKRGPEPDFYDIALKANVYYDQTCIKKMLEQKIHQSEWDWIGCEFDYVISNEGSLKDLESNVDSMLNSFKWHNTKMMKGGIQQC